MTKLHKELLARIDKAAWEYNMFESGDHILITVSGGADSMALLDLLAHRIRYIKNIDLTAVYVDMGFQHAAERKRVMQNFFECCNVKGTVIKTEIGPFSHSDANRENPCFLCTRRRRKIIFETADKFGCNKIAWGHHKDDMIETLLLNMFYNREISTMPPRLEVFHGKFQILRPLMYIEEELLKKHVKERGLPVFDQECPSDGHTKRQYAKDLIKQIEQEIPGVRENIFNSMKRVEMDYLL
ncbi:MAG: ATP-binding protein [candidate division KSB1 bacterium]|nr:ATP-binding protein [candidate division KSB1 bacterium]